MLWVDPRFRVAFEVRGWRDSADVTGYFGRDLPRGRKTVRVHPSVLPMPEGAEVAVFYKQYEFARPAWQFIGRRSKARCEFENYAVFEALGIRAARRVACGEERDGWGRLVRAWILTEAVPESATLLEFFACHGSPKDRQVRRQVILEVAAMTRQAHASRFLHRDLVWRNILVTAPVPGEVKTWWIDCPRGRPRRWYEGFDRGRLRDLAGLDKSAARYCSRSERALFLREYLGRTRFDAEVRRWGLTILKYRRQRWPEDWEETPVRRNPGTSADGGAEIGNGG